jgi:hypothetical protein
MYKQLSATTSQALAKSLRILSTYSDNSGMEFVFNPYSRRAMCEHLPHLSHLFFRDYAIEFNYFQDLCSLSAKAVRGHSDPTFISPIQYLSNSAVIHDP